MPARPLPPNLTHLPTYWHAYFDFYLLGVRPAASRLAPHADLGRCEQLVAAHCELPSYLPATAARRRRRRRRPVEVGLSDECAVQVLCVGEVGELPRALARRHLGEGEQPTWCVYCILGGGTRQHYG